MAVMLLQESAPHALLTTTGMPLTAHVQIVPQDQVLQEETVYASSPVPTDATVLLTTESVLHVSLLLGDGSQVQHHALLVLQDQLLKEETPSVSSPVLMDATVLLTTESVLDVSSTGDGMSYYHHVPSAQATNSLREVKANASAAQLDATVTVMVNVSHVLSIGDGTQPPQLALNAQPTNSQLEEQLNASHALTDVFVTHQDHQPAHSLVSDLKTTNVLLAPQDFILSEEL